MKYLVRITRILNSQDEDMEEEGSFQLFEAESIEDLEEVVAEENEGGYLDYAIPYHPVFPRLMEDFGFGALDGVIRTLISMELAPTPEVIIVGLQFLAEMSEEGIPEEYMEFVTNYMDEGGGANSEIAGPVEIKGDGGDYSIN